MIDDKEEMGTAGYALFETIFTPELLEAINKQTSLSQLMPTHRDRIMQRTRITDIDEILRDLQERIDYEKETCSCCGINPNDLRDY